jgi:hypothetical protein
MAGQLSNAARRLELARGSRGGASAGGPQGLVWSEAGARVDRAALREGDRVVEDFTIVDARGVEPSIAIANERVTSDPDEVGVVYAYDGRVIGAVTPGRRGGHVLEFTWPDDLPACAPAAAGG